MEINGHKIAPGADLSGADLRRADLRGADLRWADLSGADLSEANLRWAYLNKAGLLRARLDRADLRGAKGLPENVAAALTIVPEGRLVGWKKLRNGAVARLIIPEEARRSNGTGRKCRAEFATVSAIFGPHGRVLSCGFSLHEPLFRYTAGATVRPTEPFDPDRWNECAPGIHFYLTREEAEAHE